MTTCTNKHSKMNTHDLVKSYYHGSGFCKRLLPYPPFHAKCLETVFNSREQGMEPAKSILNPRAIFVKNLDSDWTILVIDETV